jgi:hypothetical protein
LSGHSVLTKLGLGNCNTCCHACGSHLLLLLLLPFPAKTQLDERDPSGHILAVVLRWRQLRQAALEAEISRMNSMLEVLRDVAADAGEL